MSKYECQIEVKRKDVNGNEVVYTIPSNNLVPGDIIKVPESTKMP